MEHSSKIIGLLLAVAVSTACTHGFPSIEKHIISRAEVQLTALAEASSVDGIYRIPSTYKDGEIRYTSANDWVSGFFAGSLWYMYELTGNEYYSEQAQQFTQVLEDIQYLTSHHDIGFMINDSYGNGLRLKNIPGYEDVIVNAAKSLSTRYRPAAGVIQSWNADSGWQAQKGWKCPVIIDNMMNLDLLFNATRISGDSTYFNIAVSHADRTIENHFRDDYSSYHVVDYDPETGEVRGRYTAQGYADESAWARGQSWGLYGFTAAYRNTGYQRFLDQANAIASFILNHPNLPEDLVPYWDYDVTDTYRDVSSAAILASALYELYSFTDNTLYLEKADGIVASLSGPEYMAEEGENGGFLLMHSVGSIPHGSNVDVPLNYADYYLLEALLRRRTIIE